MLGLCVFGCGTGSSLDTVSAGGPYMSDIISGTRDGVDPMLADSQDGRIADLEGGDTIVMDGGEWEISDASNPSFKPCLDFTGTPNVGGTVWYDGLKSAVVSVQETAGCQRTYLLSTDEELMDGLPENPRTVVESEPQPTLRTGHALFDALYALALNEVAENSVDVISDGGFNNGQPVACGAEGCFETGRKWTYVWTRDTAYSVDLGLSGLSPLRSRNSLLFKVSPRRDGSDTQIVQDTGSGGSWPVSTDRVSWVLGAASTLAHLSDDAAAAFLEVVRDAIINTVEYDRLHIFDPVLGLYRGEQSFLDWREQSYPVWTADNVADIAMSNSLSTNVLHFRALRMASDVSTDSLQAAQFDEWATSLREAINDRLWLAEDGLYSTYITTALDPRPAHRYDLLGLSLAVLSDIATPEQMRSVLEKYPHYGPGAPVLWPQQQDIPIYHNRGEWPFVTAYWLRAAAKVRNDAVAARMMSALVRGAALNLSNMENFEASSGANYQAEGATSGPIVNSQRQLWSVAGYLSMVQHTLFGVHVRYRFDTKTRELAVSPYLPRTIRRSWFSGADTLVLNDMPIGGKRVTVVLQLPDDAGQGGGAYTVESVALDGVLLDGDVLSLDELPTVSRLDVTLAIDSMESEANIRTTTDDDFRQVFGPFTPVLSSVVSDSAGIRLELAPAADSHDDILYSIYRDGDLVGDDIPGSSTTWVDTDVDVDSEKGICYTIEARFKVSGNRSQRAKPQCYWGVNYELIQVRTATELQAVGGELVDNHGRFHYQNWGQPGHSLTAKGLVAQSTGRHLLQVVYGNGSGPINTGITCAVKRIRVFESVSGNPVSEGTLAMPQLATWNRWEDSTVVAVELVSGVSYDIIIDSDSDVSNMSEWAHFKTYTAGEGGIGGAWNYVNIAEIKLLPW